VTLCVPCDLVSRTRNFHAECGADPLTRTLRARQLASVERDARKAKRYPLAVPVNFCWGRRGRVLQEARGTTLDISDRGVFIVCDFIPVVGAHLEIEIHLPSASGEPKSVRLHGEGKVVRASRKGPVLGFAAEVVLQTDTSGDVPLCSMGLIN
jgi:PilZ domain